MTILGTRKFLANLNYEHGMPEKIGVLLVNLGTPEAPTPKAVRPYLKEFLSDPRVVEIPRLIWWPILNFIILNIRPKKSAEKYASVWTKDGSPLMVNSIGQLDGLKRLLMEANKKIVVEFAMRYGNPSIDSAILRMMVRTFKSCSFYLSIHSTPVVPRLPSLTKFLRVSRNSETLPP